MGVIVKYISGLEEPLSNRYRLLDVDNPDDLHLITESFKAIYLNESGGEIYGPGLVREFVDGDYVLKNKKTGEILLRECDEIKAICKKKTSRGSKTGIRYEGMIYYKIAYTEEKGLFYYRAIKSEDQIQYDYWKLKSCICDKKDGNFLAILEYNVNGKDNKSELTSKIIEWIEANYKYFYLNTLYTELLRNNICESINSFDIGKILDTMIKEKRLVTKVDGNKNIYYEVVNPLDKPYTRTLNKE